MPPTAPRRKRDPASTPKRTKVEDGGVTKRSQSKKREVTAMIPMPSTQDDALDFSHMAGLELSEMQPKPATSLSHLLAPPTFGDDDDDAVLPMGPPSGDDDEPVRSKATQVLVPPLECSPTIVEAKSDNKYIMELVTIYSTEMKKMMEALSRFVSYTTFIWTPKGFEIREYDEARSTLVDVRMGADKFDKYYCSVPMIRKYVHVSTV